MTLGILGFIGWGIFLVLTAIGLFIWGYKKGQFKDIEEAKYRMLEDREPEPWPGRESNSNNNELQVIEANQQGGNGL
jgi:cbb3-type cytochrome oxidase maturation protein